MHVVVSVIAQGYLTCDQLQVIHMNHGLLIEDFQVELRCEVVQNHF